MSNSKGTALVTGGAKRIGRELALALAERNFSLAIHYHHSKKEVEDLLSEVRKLGVKASSFQADLSQEKEFTSLVPKVSKEFPDLNLLINNASVFQKASLRETSIELFNRQFDINFRAPYFLTRDFSKYCKKGQVINFLDTRITSNIRGDHFAYTLSKKALDNFTKMAAIALAPNIRVNGIAPGFLLAPGKKSENSLEPLIKNTPLERKPELRDLVRGVLFLVENESVTGQVLFINGGEHL